MTTDANDKVQSKFPRASLRARNKTLMITPADVGDFQVTSKKKTNRDTDVADEFDDPLSALDDTSNDRQDAGSEDEISLDPKSSPDVKQALDESLEALSGAFGSDEGESEAVEEREDSVGFDSIDDSETESSVSLSLHFGDDSKLVDAEDIFAAPSVIASAEEELFSGAAAVPASDPISRGTRSTQSVLGSFGSSSSGAAGYDTRQDVQVAGSPRGSVLRGLVSGPRDLPQEHQSGEAREYVDWKKLGKLVGFLVSYVSDPMGRYVELREGRLLVTSGESSSDSSLVILDESVSAMHAIMRIAADGAILILDQLSEHGTRIRRAEGGKVDSLMGDKSSLGHGDVVIFGECEYHVVVMGAAALKREDASKKDE